MADHTPIPAVVFDDRAGELAPLADFRPIFDVRTGAMRSLERLRHGLRLDVQALFVPTEFEALAADRHPVPINEVPEGDSAHVLVINGRLALPIESITALEPGQSLNEAGSGDLIAAKLTRAHARELLTPDRERPAMDESVLGEQVLMSRPWHFRSVRDMAIETDMKVLTRRGSRGVADHCSLIGSASDVIIDDRAVVHPQVVFDATHGPIVVSAGVTIRPGSILCGPCAIGPGSTVLDRTLVKANTAIGPTCKIAGEVGGCVFQGLANKAHDGHLGDSWVGEWVNLGAGTTNSNLLNTYGEVPALATPGGRRERSGEQYLGAVLADHVKTAICTRLMTGVVVHTGAMLAATAASSGCVAPFSWCTDAGDRLYKLDKFTDVMHAMMGRRDVEPSAAYLGRLRTLHAAETERRAPA